MTNGELSASELFARLAPSISAASAAALEPVLTASADARLAVNKTWSGYAGIASLSARVAEAGASITNQFRTQMAASAQMAFEVSTLTAAVQPLRFRTPPALQRSMDSIAEHLERVRRHFDPPNWSGLDHDAVIEVLLRDGIPLVWIPRAEVVLSIVEADSLHGRLSELEANKLLVAADCREVLVDVRHQALRAHQSLASAAVAALADGHSEAAGALAVVQAESIIRDLFNDRRYEVVQRRVPTDLDGYPISTYRVAAALIPIARFYERWHPDSGVPRPEHLSRHVVVHQPTAGQLVGGYGVQAVMLLVSLLRAFQEARDTEDDPQLLT